MNLSDNKPVFQRKNLYLGLDLGSISLNTVIIDQDKNILENYYDLCHGQPFLVLRKRLSDLLSKYEIEDFKLLALTGTGGKLATELIGGQFINEIIAQSKSVSKLHSEAKTIIEMGGEDSKLIFMDKGHEAAFSSLADFNMNSICAAGTGSFLDQQAKRIGVSIEKEFGELALLSENPPHIAGRCSVFAKSDMIHLQQIATPVHDIVAGLCFAVARNFKSNLAKGKELVKPIVFQGGVAANAGVVHAFNEILNLKDGELIIPEYHASMGALGAIFYVMESPDGTVPFKGISDLETYLLKSNGNNEGLPVLKESAAILNKTVSFSLNGQTNYPVYLGIDVGSLSTNVVLIDDSSLGTKVKDGKKQKTLLSEAEEDRIIATFNAKQAVEDFSMMVSYSDIAAKNYSLSAGQYFDVKIEYSDLTPAQFAAKMQSFTDNLDKLFKESAGFEKEIKKQLAGLQYE